MIALENCRCCGQKNRLERGICVSCTRAYGPRVARLLARCLADADFTSACLARLPETARLRFASLLSARCLAAAVKPGLRYTRIPTALRTPVSA